MSADAEGLLADLETVQWTMLGILADEAEDRGLSHWAAGWRWLAERKRWPVLTEALPDPEREDPGGVRWEWWRQRDDRVWSCALPALLLEHVRRENRTAKTKTCSFASAGAALRCASYCAGNLIALVGSVD